MHFIGAWDAGTSNQYWEAERFSVDLTQVLEGRFLPSYFIEKPVFKLAELMNVLFMFPGVLACLDGYMNIALEHTEEYINGELKNKYGDAFIRGNNGQCYLTF